MLSSRTNAHTTLTTFAPGQSWFSPSKTGKPVAKAAPPKVTIVKVVQKQKSQVTGLSVSQDGSKPSVGATGSDIKRGRAPSSPASSSFLSSLSPVASPPKAHVASMKKSSKLGQSSSSKDASANVKKRTSSTTPSVTRNKKFKGETSLESDRGVHRGDSLSAIPPDFQDVYRNSSRSRSTTAFDRLESARPDASRKLQPRKTWCDEDGSVGEDFMTCEKVIRTIIPKYKAYFRNPHDIEDKRFEPHPTDYPYLDLEYPNDNASERFILLEPRDKDHYNPIMCLETTLHTIIRNYLTPEQKALFGTLPEDAFKIALTEEKLEATVSTSSDSSLSSLTSLGSNSNPADSPTPVSRSSSPLPHIVPEANLLRALSRAKHTRDGPMFKATMEKINTLLKQIKASKSTDGTTLSNPLTNPLRARPHDWAVTGIPEHVSKRIINETYQRTIGPNIDKLRRYSAFSSEVYGELEPQFISEIFKATGLGPDMLYLDLGSGVGNTVLQAALETGCKAFGIEIMDAPAALAEYQLQQMKMRCKMWGVDMGDVELVLGDMTTHRRVDELMSKADVVLVNNFVFKEELNAALRPKFLDLKEGAVVVSLKPFADPANTRMTERNIDDISAIFDVVTRPYHSGTVSWSSGSGNWYLHRVDRQGYSDCREQYERIHSKLSRRKVRR